MPIMAVLTLRDSLTGVLVNPLTITHIVPNEDDSTDIYFNCSIGNDERAIQKRISVSESISRVQVELLHAMRDDLPRSRTDG